MINASLSIRQLEMTVSLLRSIDSPLCDIFMSQIHDPAFEKFKCQINILESDYCRIIDLLRRSFINNPDFVKQHRVSFYDLKKMTLNIPGSIFCDHCFGYSQINSSNNFTKPCFCDGNVNLTEYQY